MRQWLLALSMVPGICLAHTSIHPNAVAIAFDGPSVVYVGFDAQTHRPQSMHQVHASKPYLSHSPRHNAAQTTYSSHAAQPRNSNTKATPRHPKVVLSKQVRPQAATERAVSSRCLACTNKKQKTYTKHRVEELPREYRSHPQKFAKTQIRPMTQKSKKVLK